MELSQIIPHIEALIFASDKPLTTTDLVELVNNALGFIEDRATLEQIETAVEGIREKYSAEFYAFELRQIGGGLQFLTKKEFHKTVAQLNGEKFLKRLSTAALETLAIIAYKQPIPKSEIEAIRGVNCDYAVQKLLEKDLVIISGRNEDAVGKPLIYSTSKSFMDYFGINSADELPKISEVLMEELVNSTNVANAQAEQAEYEAALNAEDEAIVETADAGEAEENALNEEATEGLVEEQEADPEVDGSIDLEEAEILDEAEIETAPLVVTEAGEIVEEEADEEDEKDEA